MVYFGTVIELSLYIDHHILYSVNTNEKSTFNTLFPLFFQWNAVALWAWGMYDIFGRIGFFFLFLLVGGVNGTRNR